MPSIPHVSYENDSMVGIGVNNLRSARTLAHLKKFSRQVFKLDHVVTVQQVAFNIYVNRFSITPHQK
jgi:hypothetical protein